MKVNQYDPDNIQKGRMMLLNLAEDLKEYAKVKVSPVKDKSKQGDVKYEEGKSALELQEDWEKS